MTDKIRVGILFGGRSAEHEVSVRSARSVLEAIDRDKYDVTMIGIDRGGRWLAAGDAARVLEAGKVEGDDLLPAVLGYAGERELTVQNGAGPGSVSSQPLDVIFPILHGPYGEDGTVQGLLELADVAYVGSGVLGSAVGMDKDMMKRVFGAAGFPQVAHTAVLRRRWLEEREAVQREIERDFDYPVFVKPANMGSSVGVTKAHDRTELARGMDTAARFDRKIIVEEAALECREVECSVLGNDDPEVSVVGEIVPASEFYDYEAKYIDDKSELLIPARISDETSEAVRDMAREAFLAVEASGLARMDFFVGVETEEILLNEINTLPGFTPISMYPKLWDASGVSYRELIDRLIQLAMERHGEHQQTSTDR